jgi:hypothetical protein
MVPACGGEPEGQPCSILGENSGDSECKDGLTCTAADQLNGGGYTKDVCCPTDRSQATTLICSLPSNPVLDAGAPPDAQTAVDSGALDSSPADAADGASSEAATDAASTDSASDGASSDGASTDGAADGATDAADAHTAGG